MSETMNYLDRKVQQLLASPLGCAFLVRAAESGLSNEAITHPRNSLRIAAKSVNAVERWRSDHHEAVLEIMQQGQRKEPLARALLEHPATSWWFSPPDLQRQVWVARADSAPDLVEWGAPQGPPGPWERYAQKPRTIPTSTLWGESTASIPIAYAERSGDYWCSYPLACWLLEMPAEAHIYEVNGPESWHNLCVRYPATGDEDDRLVPNWEAAARDWDGVHLSFGGLLTCEQVRYESPAGWSQHEFWHAEITFWINPSPVSYQRLPDHWLNHVPV